jgi:hypothetical protein
MLAEKVSVNFLRIPFHLLIKLHPFYTFNKVKGEGYTGFGKKNWEDFMREKFRTMELEHVSKRKWLKYMDLAIGRAFFGYKRRD